MKLKKFICFASLAVILAFGVFAMSYAYQNVPLSYDGRDTDVTALYADPAAYDSNCLLLLCGNDLIFL